MKPKKIALTLIAISFFSGMNNRVFAQNGIGGGDPCRNVINHVREELKGWIERDEAKDLDFSKAQTKGWTYDGANSSRNYKQSMLSVLENEKVVVTCYLSPDLISDPFAREVAAKNKIQYKSITIGSPPTPTTCVNYEDKAGVSHIDCDYSRVVKANALEDPIA